MEDNKRILSIVKILEREYSEARCTLNFKNNFQLMVGAILSAQCSDEQVNRATPKLFERFKNPEDLAKARLEEIQKYIKVLGLYRNKSRNLKKTAGILVKKFSYKVPDNMEDLLKLPGVGRKIANVILSVGFGKNEGIAVDTHNLRVNKRLGIIKDDKPSGVEKELMEIVPKKNWDRYALMIIAHGRKICQARIPKCKVCPLNKLCPKIGVEKKFYS